MGVNETGLAFALLDWFRQPPRKRLETRRLNEVIPLLLTAATFNETRCRIRPVHPARGSRTTPNCCSCCRRLDFMNPPLPGCQSQTNTYPMAIFRTERPRCTPFGAFQRVRFENRVGARKRTLSMLHVGRDHSRRRPSYVPLRPVDPKS